MGKEFVEINYGPWDRLKADKPFVKGVGEKPAGANFYPVDMTKEEFNAASFEGKSSLYSFVRRDDNGNLYSIPYHKQFEKEVTEVSNLLLEASKLGGKINTQAKDLGIDLPQTINNKIDSSEAEIKEHRKYLSKIQSMYNMF